MCRACERKYGAGTHLKRLIGWLGGSCPNCDRRAKEMDANGPQWCAENLDTIVGWLRESAAERGLPFSAFVARRLVRAAILRAEPPP